MAFTLFMVLKIDAKGFSLVATCQFKPKVFGVREKGEGSVHFKKKQSLDSIDIISDEDLI